MVISENTLKWVMRLYPPLLFQRIWVKKIHHNFTGIDVKINRTVITSNLGNAIFGGTLFSATDPFHALLLGQIMQHKGFKITVWLKSAHIQYLKPARTDMFFSIKITEEDINEFETALSNQGKIVKQFNIQIFDKSGELCITAINEVYMRNLNFKR